MLKFKCVDILLHFYVPTFLFYVSHLQEELLGMQRIPNRKERPGASCEFLELLFQLQRVVTEGWFVLCVEVLN